MSTNIKVSQAGKIVIPVKFESIKSTSRLANNLEIILQNGQSIFLENYFDAPRTLLLNSEQGIAVKELMLSNNGLTIGVKTLTLSEVENLVGDGAINLSSQVSDVLLFTGKTTTNPIPEQPMNPVEQSDTLSNNAEMVAPVAEEVVKTTESSGHDNKAVIDFSGNGEISTLHWIGLGTVALASTGIVLGLKHGNNHHTFSQNHIHDISKVVADDNGQANAISYIDSDKNGNIDQILFTTRAGQYVKDFTLPTAQSDVHYINHGLKQIDLKSDMNDAGVDVIIKLDKATIASLVQVDQATKTAVLFIKGDAQDTLELKDNLSKIGDVKFEDQTYVQYEFSSADSGINYKLYIDSNVNMIM